jgi:hypothetical protein
MHAAADDSNPDVEVMIGALGAGDVPRAAAAFRALFRLFGPEADGNSVVKPEQAPQPAADGVLIDLVKSPEITSIRWWIAVATAWLKLGDLATCYACHNKAEDIADSGRDTDWSDLGALRDFRRLTAAAVQPATRTFQRGESHSHRRTRVRRSLGMGDQSERLPLLASRRDAQFEFICAVLMNTREYQIDELCICWQKLGAGEAAVEQFILANSQRNVADWLSTEHWRDLQYYLYYCAQALNAMGDQISAYAAYYLAVLFDKPMTEEEERAARGVPENEAAATARDFLKSHHWAEERLADNSALSVRGPGGSKLVGELLSRGEISLAGGVIERLKSSFVTIHGPKVIARQRRLLAQTNGWLDRLVEHSPSDQSTRDNLASDLRRPEYAFVARHLAQFHPASGESGRPLLDGLAQPLGTVPTDDEPVARCKLRLGRAAGTQPELGQFAFGPGASILSVGAGDCRQSALRLVESLRQSDTVVLWIHASVREDLESRGLTPKMVCLRLESSKRDDHGVIANARELKSCVYALADGLDQTLRPLAGNRRLWTRERMVRFLGADPAINGVKNLATKDEVDLKKIAVGLANDVLGRAVRDCADFRLVADCIAAAMPVLRSINRVCRIDWTMAPELDQDTKARPDAIRLDLEGTLTTDAVVAPLLLIGSLFQQIWRRHIWAPDEGELGGWDGNLNPIRRRIDDALMPENGVGAELEAANKATDQRVPAGDAVEPGTAAAAVPLLPPEEGMLWTELRALRQSTPDFITVVLSGRWPDEGRTVLNFLRQLDSLGTPRVAVAALLDLDEDREAPAWIDRNTIRLFRTILYGDVGGRTRRSLAMALGHCDVKAWQPNAERVIAVRRTLNSIQKCELMPW